MDYLSTTSQLTGALLFHCLEAACAAEARSVARWMSCNELYIYIYLDLYLDPRSTVHPISDIYIQYLFLFLHPIYTFCPYQYLIAISISSLNLCLRIYIYCIYLSIIYDIIISIYNLQYNYIMPYITSVLYIYYISMYCELYTYVLYKLYIHGIRTCLEGDSSPNHPITWNVGELW